VRDMGYFRDWMGWSSGSLEKVERLSSAVPTQGLLCLVRESNVNMGGGRAISAGARSLARRISLVMSYHSSFANCQTSRSR